MGVIVKEILKKIVSKFERRRRSRMKGGGKDTVGGDEELEDEGEKEEWN